MKEEKTNWIVGRRYVFATFDEAVYCSNYIFHTTGNILCVEKTNRKVTHVCNIESEA